MMNSTVVPALALAASLAELASMLERTSDLEYLVPRPANRGRLEAAGATIGAHVAHCVRQVSAVLGDADADAFAHASATATAATAGTAATATTTTTTATTATATIAATVATTATAATVATAATATTAGTRGTPATAATIAIEHSRRRGLSALRAVIADLDAAANRALADPLLLQPRCDPQGSAVWRSATAGRRLALLLPQVRDHKARVAQVLAVASCAS